MNAFSRKRFQSDFQSKIQSKNFNQNSFLLTPSVQCTTSLSHMRCQAIIWINVDGIKIQWLPFNKMHNCDHFIFRPQCVYSFSSRVMKYQAITRANVDPGNIFPRAFFAKKQQKKNIYHKHVKRKWYIQSNIHFSQRPMRLQISTSLGTFCFDVIIGNVV